MVVRYEPGTGNVNGEKFYFTNNEIEQIKIFVRKWFPGKGTVFIRGSGYEARVDATQEVLLALIENFPKLQNGEMFRKSNGYYTLRLDRNSAIRQFKGATMEPIQMPNQVNNILETKLNNFFKEV